MQLHLPELDDLLGEERQDLFVLCAEDCSDFGPAPPKVQNQARTLRRPGVLESGVESRFEFVKRVLQLPLFAGGRVLLQPCGPTSWRSALQRSEFSLVTRAQ